LLPAGTFSFGAFELDAAARRLTRAGEPIAMPDRHLGVLLELVSHPGVILSKDALIEAVWRDVAVTDNSLEQAVSALRRVIGDGPDGVPRIQTVARQGYRFTGHVTRTADRATDATLDALLAPHRAWIEGRSALETLERGQIVHARDVFERVLRSAPDEPSAHVGLANACVMQFEMTRADESPDLSALAAAAGHAREACRLARDYGEAWATLGFVLDRSGDRVDALAASRRATQLEPDNWRHHFRLAFVSWGEERLREARRTLTLMPGFPLAHWLAATVHVARQALPEADRELSSGIANEGGTEGGSRFSGVALHWLRGLIRLADEDHGAALEAFERELSRESSGHLYARECCANAWYAIGALRHRQGDHAGAAEGFRNALARVTAHPLARLGLAAVGDRESRSVADPAANRLSPVDVALGRAVRLVLDNRHAEAAGLVSDALAATEADNAGWLLPVEPILHVSARPEAWAQALARLRSRAA
jgi:DNA-binding winged helix-turn-helix (wHTH) protein